MSKTDITREQEERFDSRAHHSRLRVLVMVIVGMGTALAVGALKSWAYAPAEMRLGLD